MRRWTAVALFVAFTGILAWQLFLPGFIGIGDTGDFGRVAGWLCLSPRPTPNHFAYFQPEYVWSASNFWASPYRSIETALGWVAVHVAGATREGATFDIRWLALLHVGVCLAGFAAFLAALRGVVWWRQLAIGAFAIIALTDVCYVALLNSFYMDAPAFCGLLLATGAAVWMSVQERLRLSTAMLFWLGAILFAASKTQHAIWCVFPACFLAVSAWRARRGARALLIGMAVSVIAAGVYIESTADTSYKGQALFNVLFFRIGAQGSQAMPDLIALGAKPAEVRYLGMHSYSPASPMADRQFAEDFYRRTGFARLSKWYAAHPITTMRMIADGLLAEDDFMRPENLGNFRIEAGREPGARTHRFALWSGLRSTMFHHAPWSIPLWYAVFFAGCAMVIVRRPTAVKTRLAWVALGIGLLGAGEFVASSLADCLDVIRHLFLFHACTDLTLCFAVAWLVTIDHNMKSLRPTLAAAVLLVLTASFGTAQTNDAALIAKAKGIHDRVIKLDTHNDIDPQNFTPDCNYKMRLTTQVNLPKMVEGDMDVTFMIVYVGQGPLTPEGYDDAYRQAIAKFDAVHRFTEKIAPDQMGLALTPADVLALHKRGMRIAVIGVENGYPIGTDIKRVKELYDRGARYMSLAHNGNSQLADSNTGEAQGYLYNNGLSDLGRQVIAEMNRLGMMIDLSHPSKGANLEAIRLSKAPVIASHSSVRALADVSRNMDDELLMALKKNGGVMQTVGFASYVKVDSKERTDALAKLREDVGLTAGAGRGRGAGGGRGRGGAAATDGAEPAARTCPVEGADGAAQGGRGTGRGGRGRGAFGLDTLSPEKRAEYDKRLAEIDAKYPPAGRANVKDFVDHIDYAVKKIGIDHVGISSDFDGGGGIEGWNSAAEAFNVTLELVRRGYNEKQIGQLWSGNLLRVWGEVEQVAKKLQKP